MLKKKHKALRKKYKALILKYKPYISKYMACIFCFFKLLKNNNLQKAKNSLFSRAFIPSFFLHLRHFGVFDYFCTSVKPKEILSV